MEYIVKTPCGELRGTKTSVDGIVAYKGIRYATAGRFEYPREVTRWEGVYDATRYGTCSYQPRSFFNEAENPKKMFYYTEFRKDETYEYGEDCLFLNVFTPEQGGEKLPVIVYIHGGGFTGGCGHEKHFDVPAWPLKGVIGVTLNYRLGPFGFIALPELKEEAGKTGNYGLYDQLTALKWIKRNIAAFGGDPDNVTLMGQSAGAMSVQQHCLSPLSEGLFRKAVMCSGGGVSGALAAAAPEKRYDFWRAVMEKCGAESLEQLRKVPADVLVSAWQEKRTVIGRGGCFPCIDGELVVGVGHELLEAGKQHRIPYMIGSTGCDMMPPILYSMAKEWCKKQPEPSYLWLFDRNLPGDKRGSWHSSDLWYWFGTLDNCWRPFTEKDRALSEEMVSRLCAFAKNSVPDAEGYIKWQSGGEKGLIFGDKDTAMGDPSVIKSWITMLTNKAPGE